MDNYKFYRKDNYIVLSNEFTKETFYGFVKEVLVGKSNLNKPHYRFFNIKDWNSDTPLLITQLLGEDGSPYTQIDFEEFYRQNTGNFNGGGTAPGVQSVTGTGVDNTDPQNPVVAGLPTGTERQVVGFDESGNAEVVTIGWKQLSDLPSPPTFSNGIYTGTAFQPDGSALFAFLELGIDSPDSVARPDNIPIYQAGTIGTGGGTLPVQDPIEDLDAVNKRYLQSVATPSINIVPTGNFTVPDGVKTRIITLTSASPQDVILPAISDAVGSIFFITNDSLSTVNIKSKTGTNDIWDSMVVTNDKTVDSGTTQRIINDGVNYKIL